MLRKVMTKVSPEFKKECQEIKLARIKNGMSNKLLSDRRLTLAMVKASKWIELKDILINAEIKDDL